MISTTDRGPVEYPRDAPREHARIPCTIPVELTHDERTPGFEADAVDLSAGGLSLRSSSLPEVGSMLHCRFETLPGGTQISGRGEVVWAKLSGERSGEFGLRFTHIDPKAQALISEMIAERVANAGHNVPRLPRMATLEFEEVDGPITAKLTRSAGHDVVFEQPLDVLQLGRAVTAHADTALGQGNILRVDLRMDGGTPTLVMTARFSEAQEEYGEYDWGEEPQVPRTSPPELRAPSLTHASSGGFDHAEDTQPDLTAPLGVFEHPAQEPRQTQPGTIPTAHATLAGLDPRHSDPARETLAGLQPETLAQLQPERAATSRSGTIARVAVPEATEVAGAPRAAAGMGSPARFMSSHSATLPHGTRITPLGVHAAPAANLPAAPHSYATPHSGTQLRVPPPPPGARDSGTFAALGGSDGTGLAGHGKPAKQMDLTFSTAHDEFADADEYEDHDENDRAVHYDAIAVVGSEIPEAPAHRTEPLRLRAVEVDGALRDEDEDDEDDEDVFDDEPEPESEAFETSSGRKSVPSLDPDRDTWRPGLAYARKSALVRFLRIIAAVVNWFEIGLGFVKRGAQEANDAVMPLMRRSLTRRTQRSVNIVTPVTQPPVIRTRRTAGGPAPAAASKLKLPKGSGRLALLAMLMLGCGVLLVYAFTPEPGADQVQAHRAVQVEGEETTEATIDGEPSETAVAAATDPAAAAAAAAPAQPINNAAQQLTAATPAKRNVAAKATKPAAAPKPERNASASEAPVAAHSSMAFGASKVPNPQRYVLRMSNPITSVHGKSEPGGFRVTVPNARALDRAAPIAQSNAAVASAQILNKGGYAELSVRFADGKSPAYRVSAQQAGLEVLIGQ